ncbi:hypothetical protein SVEN_2115, partial [Streptomyces venezuelae ATCC 10712]
GCLPGCGLGAVQARRTAACPEEEGVLALGFGGEPGLASGLGVGGSLHGGLDPLLGESLGGLLLGDVRHGDHRPLRTKEAAACAALSASDIGGYSITIDPLPFLRPTAIRRRGAGTVAASTAGA